MILCARTEWSESEHFCAFCLTTPDFENSIAWIYTILITVLSCWIFLLGSVNNSVLRIPRFGSVHPFNLHTSAGHVMAVWCVCIVMPIKRYNDCHIHIFDLKYNPLYAICLFVRLHCTYSGIVYAVFFQIMELLC